jgi:peptidoglycan DL-endopeptidase CwlO
MTGARSKVMRVALAAAVVAPVFLAGLPAPSGAATRTSQAQVLAARRKLNDLNQQLELAVEQFNEAKVRLGIVEVKLQAARVTKDTAQAQADAARLELSRRAVEAYTGAGSQLDVLLGAQSMSDFSDQIEFMGALAQSDADLATTADAAQAQAAWATQQYEATLGERQIQVDQMQQRQAQIQRLVNQQRAEYTKTSTSRKQWVAYVKAQREAARQAAKEASSGSSGGGGGGYVPPPNASGAEIAIGAARSVIGAPYVWGSADPNVGFDCSGLTSWAWGQAGVSLPHSSELQYEALPHVSLDQIEPGDLLFFYTPISHVAMYIGNNQMIHARHPGPGGEVQINAMDSMWMDDFVGAARPG